jgi:site-specific recombinase XerD
MVVDAAKIDKQLSSHCLRHTFAMYALNHGLSMEVVGRILGHTKLATTQIYAKMLSATVEDAMIGLEKSLLPSQATGIEININEK